MSQTNSRFFDEFARLMTNAAGAAQGVRQEVDTLFKTQAERVLRDLDVVPREEFDAVRDMAVKARKQNEALEARIVELETSMAKLSPVAKAPKKQVKSPTKQAKSATKQAKPATKQAKPSARKKSKSAPAKSKAKKA